MNDSVILNKIGPEWPTKNGSKVTLKDYKLRRRIRECGFNPDYVKMKVIISPWFQVRKVTDGG